MKKIDFKHPKYILPLIMIPFLVLINYAMTSFGKTQQVVEATNDGNVKSKIGDVSEKISDAPLDSKLSASRKQFRRATNGYSGIANLTLDVQEGLQIESQYNDEEKKILDSIEKAMRIKYPPQNLTTNNPSNTSKSISNEDQELLKAINNLQGKQTTKKTYEDPMDLFRAQMAVIDSMNRANDPSNKVVNKEVFPEAEEETSETLRVKKADAISSIFNTVTKISHTTFIKAIVDEDIKKGTLGARLRIRLLDDIQISDRILNKGTYLFASISGYESQRVKLSITTVMVGDNIYPINLQIYDNDGLEGLYVPESAFREFSKDLGSNTASGMNVQMQQDPSNISQMYMSALQRMFTSTSQAVSKTIRKNKANVKYGTFLYLVDPEELRESNQFN